MFNDEHFGMKEKDIEHFLDVTKFKTVDSIQFGRHYQEVWYFTPLPHEFHVQCLYICDFCLHFCVSKKEFARHTEKCAVRAPPGDEIYREGTPGVNEIAFFEVNGSAQETYCENLTYISRMFLEHKNLVDYIAVFFFYVLCEVKEDGYHVVGYFSKEKNSESERNLSCILTLPFCQRTGYGKLLIDMSYALSIIEGRPGSPEKPLSDLGQVAYVKYWTRQIVDQLLDYSHDAITFE